MAQGTIRGRAGGHCWDPLGPIRGLEKSPRSWDSLLMRQVKVTAKQAKALRRLSGKDGGEKPGGAGGRGAKVPGLRGGNRGDLPEEDLLPGGVVPVQTGRGGWDRPRAHRWAASHVFEHVRACEGCGKWTLEMFQGAVGAPWVCGGCDGN